MSLILSILHGPPALILAQSDGGSGAGAAAGVGIFMILVWGLALLASIFWIWMLIDCLMSPMPGSEKILWFLVIFFLHLLGALIYFLMKRSSARGVTV